MSVDQLTTRLETLFKKAADPGFRSRAIAEYKRVESWVGNRIDLDSARILDFGCGEGVAAASFALRHPGATVLGLDIAPTKQDALRKMLQSQLGCDLPGNVGYATSPPDRLLDFEPFDLIYAWSVFAHVREDTMVELFRSLKGRLKKGGLFFVQADPLYYSPRGSHLYNYFKSPWHHLLLSLDELREGVLAENASAREKREWKQFLELNRLSPQDIIARGGEAGLTLVRQQSFATDIVPPPCLTRVYNRDALVTTEFMALFA